MMELAGGRYKLEKVIGQGGFATVWRGYDSALGVHRAVKLLHPNLSSRTQFRERLRAEARTMARLAHPNVLTVHDIGEQDGQDWFVMDLVEGGSLGDWQQRGGPLPPGLAVGCAIQVLSALSAAHASGVVHRDVKPQNILLDADGRCRLADFGIALLESEEMLRNTKTGATMGSLSYMAPEQRLSARSVGPSADLYAVGSTLYSLLTNANAIDLFTAAAGSARWGDVPECLRPILQRVTKHDPGARYQSAAELAQVQGSFSDGHQVLEDLGRGERYAARHVNDARVSTSVVLTDGDRVRLGSNVTLQVRVSRGTETPSLPPPPLPTGGPPHRAGPPCAQRSHLRRPRAPLPGPGACPEPGVSCPRPASTAGSSRSAAATPASAWARSACSKTQAMPADADSARKIAEKSGPLSAMRSRQRGGSRQGFAASRAGRSAGEGRAESKSDGISPRPQRPGLPAPAGPGSGRGSVCRSQESSSPGGLRSRHSGRSAR